MNESDGTPRTEADTHPAGELDPIWARLVDDLPASQRAWLAGSKPLTLHENTAIVAVRDDFTRTQLE
ncbi:MAG: chromosomal replication initiation protein DnaA, partial [Propionibacteriales bacterium]|nr:chromosomal replication initiation protein DnaA [Propionibacteriales bacterium]